MKRLFRLILLSSVLLLSVIVAIIASANEPKPETPEDNACYAGGEMDGKCDTDWEWTCGWYLARWITAGGWYGDFVMPTDCLILITLRPINVIHPIIPISTPTMTLTASPIVPTTIPSDTPTNLPTATPSDTPTNLPTATPSDTPTNLPTATPSDTPTNLPTATPSDTPTNTPTP